MEFGVALFGAVASVALSKLLTVKGQPNTDATFIRNDLNSIEAAIRDQAGKGLVSYVQIEHMSQLRDLAYDIEDCIDCFNAKKMSPEDFANKISDLRTRSKDTTDRIQRFSFRAQGADGPANGPVSVGDIPIELQNLGDYNLNCLLYLCLFPPNHHVRTKPLMRRWLAEGLVQKEKNAVDNLKVLTDFHIINSILTSNNGNVKRFQPTEAMLQYIAGRSTSEKFILLCAGEAELQAESTRRLSVYPSANGLLILPRDKFLPHLRTLAVFPAGRTGPDTYEAALDFTRYGVLRVLDLKECADMNEGHLPLIWDQVLIKYLSINLNSIGSITRGIGYLEQLETLDLSGSKTVTVFKEVLLLPKLKHLLGKFQLHKADTLWFLRRVPSDVKEFLREDSVLETLAGFVIGERVGFPQLMGLMRMLRKVKIWCQPHASQENLNDISSAITKFIVDGNRQPDLDRSLSIDFEGCPREFASTIGNAGGGILTSLKLRGHLSKFPQFVARLSSIVELCLSLTSLSWEKIRDGLRTVRGLKYLKLIEDDLDSLDILSETDQLKAIERIYVVCKKELKIAITVTQLVSVHILCHDLHVIPNKPLIDIRHMTSLKEVALHNQVQDALKDGLRHAADGRTNTVEFLFLKYPL